MPLDINLFRKEKGGDVEKLKWNQRARGKPESLVDDIIDIDQQWRQVDFSVNQLKKQKGQNTTETAKRKQEAAKLTKEIASQQDDAAKQAAQSKITQLQQEALSFIEKSLAIDKDIAAAEEEAHKLIKQRDAMLRSIGNICHESVPVHMDEANNREEKVVGEKKPAGGYTGKLYHHHELLEMIDGYSPAQGVNVAGHRGFFLKDHGAFLNIALQRYGLAFLKKRGYSVLQTPFFMKKDVMAKTAQLEEFDEALYHVKGEDEQNFYLIATSEQPISAYHMDELLEPARLPIKYAGISTCFRKEAGAHGKDTWGIFRIHQFEKVEQFVLCLPEKSYEMQDEMIRASEEFYQSLGLSYHIINIVSGALNNAAARKLDLEAWFPTLAVYRELVSCSNCTDYQSRAMNTRYSGKKPGEKGTDFVHMLNATMTATERTLCCILENYQCEDGIIVPEALRPYMEPPGLDKIPFVKPPPKQQAGVSSNEKKAVTASSAAAAPASSSASSK